MKERYNLCRVYDSIHKDYFGFTHKCSEIEIFPCKTLKEAIETSSILTDDEKSKSYIVDTVTSKKLTLTGELYYE